MVDVFEEVESEIRSERYKQLAIKLLPWIVGGVIAGVVLVGGGYGLYAVHQNAVEKSSEAYGRGLTTLQTGNGEAAFKQFAQVDASAKGYKALALMQQAGIRLADNKKKEAVALFDQAAEAAPKGDLGLLISDMARLKSAFAVMDDAPYAQVEARLKPLTEEKRPYRAEAIEALALAKVSAGKAKEGRQDLVLLSLSTDAPDGVRNRARSIVSMIDSGVLASLPAVVAAAAKLPPLTGLPPEVLQAMQQGAGGPPPADVAPPAGAPQ